MEGDRGEIPERFNGWVYDPDARWNGATWRGVAAPVAVVVFDVELLFDTALVKVYDERVSGFSGYVYLDGTPTVESGESISLREACRKAKEWMGETEPVEWSHPLVVEEVFREPKGFSLDVYAVEARQDIVEYVREEPPAGVSKQTIHVEGYRSSGNYSIAVTELREGQRVEREEYARAVEGRSLAFVVSMAQVMGVRLRSERREGAEWSEAVQG